jgi:hypothetical protein
MHCNEYIKEQIQNTDKLYYNYCGINRKEYPKWNGWKIINKYKEKNINIKDIEDEILDLLVENFYRLKYMENIN